MRTHYENLKIAENAPAEVIRAAYRALSQRYHPDKNPGNKDAVRIMQILNAAYETLSDPVQRRQYDDMLAVRRQPPPLFHPQNAQTPPPFHPQSTQSPPPFHPQSSKPPQHAKSPPSHQQFKSKEWQGWEKIRHILAFVTVVYLILALYERFSPRKSYTSKPNSYRSPRPAFFRPATAPNGQPWPVLAAYIPNYPILATGGFSSVTIDNTRNSSDVFLKLVLLNGTIVFPVRYCFIPAYSQFKFASVASGRYDVRYQDLSSGVYSKTEDFILNETRTFQGTEFSNLSLTLYKVADGNMHTQTINESDF